MKIGITEQGDAGLDLSWVKKLSNVDAAILITKNLTRKCMDAILQAHKDSHRLILHVGCTGWGNSPVEPNVPHLTTQLDHAMELIQAGFPVQNVVLRIDPIIPTNNGLQAVKNVLDYAFRINLLPQARVRISILDEYKHVKRRLQDLGYASFYPGNNFQASWQEMQAVTNLLKTYDLQYHTCAEPKLNSSEDIYVHSGCISCIDLDILGISKPDTTAVNPQNRFGCLCLNCKTELLSHKCQCPNGCLYCYWQNDYKKKDA